MLCLCSQKLFASAFFSPKILSPKLFSRKRDRTRSLFKLTKNKMPTVCKIQAHVLCLACRFLWNVCLFLQNNRKLHVWRVERSLLVRIVLLLNFLLWHVIDFPKIQPATWWNIRLASHIFLGVLVLDATITATSLTETTPKERVL